MPPRFTAEPDAGQYVAVVDDQYRWRAVSPEFAELLGYEPAELAGQPTVGIAADPDEATFERDTRHLETTGSHSGVAVLVARDGARIPFALSFRAVNGDGDVFYVMQGELWLGKATVRRPDEEWRDGDWLEKQHAADHVERSVRTIEREIAKHDRGEPGGLPAAGRPGAQRLIQFRDLKAWWLGKLMLLIVLGLLAVEAADLVLPGHDLGFPPGLGHPL